MRKGRRTRTGGSRASCLAAILRAGISCAVLSQSAAPLRSDETTTPVCTLEAGATHAVVRVIDAETVLLDDGSQVRLIGALALRAPGRDEGDAPWPPEAQAKRALEELVAGHSVELAFAGRRTDRYGRQLAHLFLHRNGERIWVQGQMLALGHARAYGLAQSVACLPELLEHEKLARVAQRGIWASAAYAIRSAARSGALLQWRSSFQIVEGTVTRVTEIRGKTYLNFGADWRTDFSVGIAGRGRNRLAGHLQLAALEGQRVRVRGWIERRNGPYIELADTGLIEIVSEAEPALASGRGARSRLAPPDAGAATEPAQKQQRPARDVPGAVGL